MNDLRISAAAALEALGLWATGCDMDAVALNDLIHRLEAALAEHEKLPMVEIETVLTVQADPLQPLADAELSLGLDYTEVKP